MKPTTFVIGAGTSVPFGMPTGLGLVKKICSSECKFNPNAHAYYWHAANSLQQGYQEKKHDSFRESLQNSGFDSVDRFIQDNAEFDLYAKSCISHILLRYEQSAAQRSIDVLDNNIHLNAFRKLWNAFGQLSGNTNDLLSELRKHRFVTFNYDRILEFFLYSTLVNGQGFSAAESMQAVKELGIVHVYGYLGEFVGDPINNYGTKVAGDPHASNLSFSDSVQSLNLLTTHRAVNENSDRVTEHFENTEQVVVLGFGFDATNCEYLRTCWVKAFGGQEDRANLKMKQVWKVCMYEKEGAPVKRARQYFRVGEDNNIRRSIGNAADHDAAFLEHNVL